VSGRRLNERPAAGPLRQGNRLAKGSEVQGFGFKVEERTPRSSAGNEWPQGTYQKSRLQTVNDTKVAPSFNRPRRFPRFGAFWPALGRAARPL